MSVIDEAFMAFEQIIEQMLAFGDELVDDEAGVRMHIDEYEIETPVELDLVRDETGALHIGTTPPLYPLETSFFPVLHRLRFVAVREIEETDDLIVSDDDG